MSREIEIIKLFFILFTIGLTLLFAGSLLYYTYREYKTAGQYAKVEAHASFNKDLLLRRWAAIHGGIYVPVTDTTPPNPYLSHIPDRDVTTLEGKELTLMNPAYMLRQVFSIAEEQYGVRGNITSLQPLRPENAPDEWEEAALKKMITGGKSELSSIVNLDDEDYMRFMHVLKIEPRCLKCHAHQGYEVGDIAGGISVLVPMHQYNQVAGSRVRSQILIYLLIYASLMLFSVIGYRRFLSEMLKRNALQKRLIENEAGLKLQNEEYAALNEEYKSQNEELSEAKEQAEESDSLKSAFLQNLSHEIRTPLNAICGFSDLLMNANLSKEKEKKIAAVIESSGKQLLSIVSDTLTLSYLETKQEKISSEKFCINHLIDELYELHKHKAEMQKLEFKTVKKLYNNETYVYTDKNKIRQVLNCLISNALKFTQEGFIEFGYDKVNQNLKFFVKDTGIGIHPSRHKKIFERFAQADSSISKQYGGAGLGLAIAKGFVELLNGKIWLEAGAGSGSTFFFTIPYNPTDSELEVEPVAFQENKKTGKTFKVLVAEDEEFNYLYIKELLDELNCEVIHAKNGKEAVDCVKANTRIDLVLMDIKMPIVDGLTAAKLIKSQNPDIYIVAQSAYSVQNEAADGKDLFDDYFLKPINRETFLKKITAYMKLT